MDSMLQPSKTTPDRNASHQQSPVEDFLKTLAVCCFLFLMVLVVFLPVKDHDFIICDDDIYIFKNYHVAAGLTSDNVTWSFTGVHAGNWHPLTWLSHMLDCEMHACQPSPPLFSGQWAGGHHLTSLLLHAASAVVLFLAMRRLTGAFWCSAFVAAMFALHPLRVESVAWAAERKDVLSGLFWMLTLWAYGGYALRPNVWRYLLIVVMFGLGLSSKSMLVTLPCVLLLLDFWPLGRWRPSRFPPRSAQEPPPRAAQRSLGWLVVEKLPLFLMSAAVSLEIAKIQRDMGAMTMVDMTNMTLIARIANAAISAVSYLGMTVHPVNLAFFYPHPVVLLGYSAARFLLLGAAAGALLLAVTALVLWNLRRRPYLAVGWFWYLGTLVPVIGLVQVGAQGMADRYTYIPVIGVSMMLAWGAAELAARSSSLKTVVGVAAGVLLTLWTVVTVNQVAHWKDSAAVFKHAIDVTPDNFFAHNHLGLVYAQNGDLASAQAEYLEAVRTAPSYDAANSNLGASYFNQQPPDFENAVRYFQNAIRVNPHNGGHRANLGLMYQRQGRFDEAEATYRGSIEVDPAHISGHENLANLLYFQRRYAEALAEWSEILRMVPDHFPMLNRVALFLATCPDPSIRNGREALKLAERSMKLSGGRRWESLDALAGAYAELGDFPAAVEAESKAVKLALRMNDERLVNSLRTRLMLYQDGKFFRIEPPPLKALSPSPQESEGK
jgi:protein O-mannosyl-transferase